ncbi:MAG: ABC-F family ATP-binding cassette domain-containing protein, partial [Oscillospiraceae bacterium]|nr:ABC-F family ATP-binding cassette domain-containing protein [Oscillospiraceae bacterium]
KFYGDHHVLQDVSFNIERGERVGLLGDNGSGKTTLFKIISGELDYDSGDILIPSDRRIAVVSQIPVYPAEFTVNDVLNSTFSELFEVSKQMRDLERTMEMYSDRDVLSRYDKLTARFEHMGGYDTETEINKTCNGLGITPDMRDRLFSSLSGGEKTRISIATALLQDPDILLLDEPTNHLDMDAVEWLENYLPSFRGTVFIISHDRYFIDKCITRIIELSDGKAEFYPGNYSFYVKEREARYEEQLKRYKAEQAEIKRLEFTAERMHGWGLGNKKLQVRAFAMEKRIERMRKTEKPKEIHNSIKAQFGSLGFWGDNVLKLSGLSKSYGEKVLFDELSLTIENGDRIALIGDNGSGKTTLLDIIGRASSPDSGSVTYNPSIKTAMLPQVISFANEDRSILDTLLYDLNVSTQTARNRLASFLFFGDEVFDSVKTLSGGERSRLKLCEIMASDINFLMLDEPTNHLDITSREWIEEAVETYGGALLFVSHDRFFINKFANRIWELSDGKILDFRGSFDEFRRTKQLTEAQKPQKSVSDTPKKEKPKAPNKKLNDKKLREVEREIAKLEAAISELETAINESASDFEKLSELYAESEKINAELFEKMALWESLYEESV